MWRAWYFPFPLKLLRLTWICFCCRVYLSPGGTLHLTWMSSNRRVRFRSWVGPIIFMTKLISVILLHSVYSPSSSVPLLTSTMCKILTTWGKKYCTLFHQVMFGVPWLILLKSPFAVPSLKSCLSSYWKDGTDFCDFVNLKEPVWWSWGTSVCGYSERLIINTIEWLWWMVTDFLPDLSQAVTQKFCIFSHPVSLVLDDYLKTHLHFEWFPHITFRMFVPRAERLLVLNLE